MNIFNGHYLNKMTSRLCQALDDSNIPKTAIGVNGSDVYTEDGLGNLFGSALAFAFL